MVQQEEPFLASTATIVPVAAAGSAFSFLLDSAGGADATATGFEAAAAGAALGGADAGAADCLAAAGAGEALAGAAAATGLAGAGC